MSRQSLLFQQLNRRLKSFSELAKIQHSDNGCIQSLREALGISLQQLGKKLSMSRQGVHAIELREQQGTITINALREVANALDMQLVYALIPKDGTLEDLLERKARALATQIVMRTSNTMKLEQQGNSEERIAKAIDEKTEELKKEMPSALWD